MSQSPLNLAMSQTQTPPYHKAEEADDDEYNWELDDRQRNEEKLNHSSSDDALAGTDGVDVDKILAAFFEKHPPSPVKSPEHVSGRLPCPVIPPQRRPQTNTRGFVLAYAPVLQDCDIEQVLWMDFLNGFHKAIKASLVALSWRRSL
jgi:hypothetical protein